jgi:preprotein translocase subunit SecF
MVIAVWLLGVGTLMDLALVQLVGVIVGTYSSIYFATPLLVTLRERTTVVRNHTRRVLNRRKGSAAKQSDTDEDSSASEVTTASAAAVPTAAAPDKPAPGARPTGARTGRPSGKRNTRRR